MSLPAPAPQAADPVRYRTDEDFARRVPVHVVWELTLACDLHCHHCGSRAGRRRPSELTTRECLDVVEALARLGTREVSLIGGEAYLRDDWTDIIRAIRSHDMYCVVQTGGRQLTAERLDAAIAADTLGAVVKDHEDQALVAPRLAEVVGEDV